MVVACHLSNVVSLENFLQSFNIRSSLMYISIWKKKRNDKTLPLHCLLICFIAFNWRWKCIQNVWHNAHQQSREVQLMKLDKNVSFSILQDFSIQINESCTSAQTPKFRHSVYEIYIYIYLWCSTPLAFWHFDSVIYTWLSCHDTSDTSSCHWHSHRLLVGWVKKTYIN